jgi:hypothetical protein
VVAKRTQRLHGVWPWGTGPIPANTFVTVVALAVPGMLVEIDVTAVVVKCRSERISTLLNRVVYLLHKQTSQMGSIGSEGPALPPIFGRSE